MCYQIDVHFVRAKAAGRWGFIFGRLAPQLKNAMEKAGRHVACPIHGGEDGFRLFRNFDVNGSGVCNTCGMRRDGFAMLEWVNGWSFRKTLEAVAKVLDMPTSGDFEVLEEIRLDRKFVGVVVGIEDEADRFVLQLADEKTGEVRNLFFLSLRGPVKAAGVVSGDRVCLSQVARQKVRIAATGREFHHSIWTVEKLPTVEVEQREEAARRERDARCARAIDVSWNRSCPVTEVPPVLRYLERRGLSGFSELVLADLRGLQKTVCRDGDAMVECSAMVAAVRNVEGKLVALHRTFLTEDGVKAPVAAPKRISALPSDRTIAGCAVHFGEPKEKLAVAEGIETALSVVKATGMPCWSCLSAHGLETIEVPEGVETIFIYADKDRSETGQRAAENLRKRLLRQGTFSVVLLPSEDIPEGAKGVDWNDVLVTDGVQSFSSCQAS